jgi:hypothetical protein
MAIGVFGLQVAYRLKRLEVMSADDTHGWFGGGSTPTAVSTVDRIDFSNDTGIANIRGPLSSTRYRPAATGNSNYGWFGGGYNLSTVDRIDFSNDNATASPRGSLSRGRSDLAATGNSNYGWFGGGGPGPFSTVNRIDFSNDSATPSPRGPLFASRYRLAATGNSNYGWFGGGGPGFVATVDRIDFSNDSATASPRGPLSQGRRHLAATGNSNYGWFGGGTTTGTSGTLTIDRIDFSNDSSTTSPRGSLSSARYRLAATGNSNYGWFGGGTPGSGFSSIVDRIDFSNDSVSASPRAPLSSPSPSPGGRSELAATSGQAKGPAIKLQKAGNYGWYAGGSSAGAPFASYSRIDRIDFSNDSSTASIRNPLTGGKYLSAATGNSNYGWFGAQFDIPTPGRVSTVDRIDFSNDNASTSIRGPLSTARNNAAATGNSNYGWFGGGYPGTGAGVSRVDRINFSNDNATASIRGPLSAIKYNTDATGNSNYGWWGGGTTQPSPSLPPVYYSSTERIDFSNDNVTALPRAVLNAPGGISVMGATGNSNYGWFGGGFTNTPTPAVLSIVDRIDFSNDSVTPLSRGLLSVARNAGAATGNSNYGWFGGGSAPGARSTVDRVNFSNDSVSASPRGPLSLARSSLAATSNTPIG